MVIALGGRVLWTEEPGGLQPMALQRVGHHLATKQQQQPIVLVLEILDNLKRKRMYGLEFKRMSWCSFSMRGGRQCSFWLDTEREISKQSLKSNADLSWDLGKQGPWTSAAPRGCLVFEVPTLNFSHFSLDTGESELAVPSKWDSLTLYQAGPMVLIPPFRASSHPLLFFGVDQMPQETWASCLWCPPGTRDLLGVGCLERG